MSDFPEVRIPCYIATILRQNTFSTGNEDTALRVSDNATQDALLQDENQRTQSKEYI